MAKRSHNKRKGKEQELDNYTNKLVIDLNKRIQELRKRNEELEEQVSFYQQFI